MLRRLVGNPQLLDIMIVEFRNEKNIEEDSSCPVSGGNSKLGENSSSSLFTLRTVIHDSTGFSPAESSSREKSKDSVMLLYEKLTEEEHVESSVVDYVFELINRMKRCQKLAIPHMEDAKQKHKLCNRSSTGQIYLRAEIENQPLTGIVLARNAFEESQDKTHLKIQFYTALDFTKPFIIRCDASNLVIGVVLLASM
ncbi:retrovirus-related Pol polyprotein from transposon 412 [Trichonephila clavipes]|nr:retrovirus-related Pol polyprotein from transposon 412 [Trichonephila clavipes]